MSFISPPSARCALLWGQRFDNDRPVRGSQPAEVLGIGGLHDAAARFDRHRDGMGVREERGTRASLGEKSPDKAVILLRSPYGWPV
jgi:hypothetical protein